MHLREARVDLDGHAIADGRIDVPPDPARLFTDGAHDCVQLVQKGKFLSLAAATSRRNASGFFQTERSAFSVGLPQALAVEMLAALRNRRTGPAELRLDDDQGQLSNSRAEDPSSQPLSNWFLRIEPDGGGLRFLIEADLRSVWPIPEWRGYGDYWEPAPAPAARLKAAFTVNEATRAARFGMIVLGPKLPAEDAEEGKATGLRLENALIGTVGDLLAPTPEGLFAQLSSVAFSGDSLPFDIVHRGRRLANGFLDSHSRPVWVARIWFEGFDLPALTRRLAPDRPARLNLSEWNGWVSFGWGPEVESARITEGELEARLGRDGLSVSCRVVAPSRWGAVHTRSFTLGWESILLRLGHLATFGRQLGVSP